MQEQRSAYGVLLLSVFGASCSNFFTRFSHISSMSLVTLRMLITMALFGAVLLATGGWRQLRAMTRRQLGWCAASGFVFSLHLVASFEAVRNASVATSNVLLCTEVIFVALGGLLVLHSKLDGGSWVCILLAFGGAATVALGNGGGGAGPAPLYGSLMALTGAMLSAAYTLIGRYQRSGGLSTTCYTFVVYGCCTVSILALDLIFGEPVAAAAPREYGLALGMAVCSTFLGHSLFSYCLKFLHPAYVSAGKLLIPVVSGLAAIPIFGEVPSPTALAGCAVVLLAVLAYTLRDAKAARTAPKKEAGCDAV